MAREGGDLPGIDQARRHPGRRAHPEGFPQNVGCSEVRRERTLRGGFTVGGEGGAARGRSRAFRPV